MWEKQTLPTVNTSKLHWFHRFRQPKRGKCFPHATLVYNLQRLNCHKQRMATDYVILLTRPLLAEFSSLVVLQARKLSQSRTHHHCLFGRYKTPFANIPERCHRVDSMQHNEQAFSDGHSSRLRPLDCRGSRTALIHNTGCRIWKSRNHWQLKACGRALLSVSTVDRQMYLTSRNV